MAIIPSLMDQLAFGGHKTLQDPPLKHKTPPNSWLAGNPYSAPRDGC